MLRPVSKTPVKTRLEQNYHFDDLQSEHGVIVQVQKVSTFWTG